MSHENQLVGIYRLYKLGRMSGNKFDKNIKVIDRDLHPVHHSFAEDSNSNSHINGLLYEEDKVATKKYWNKEPYDNVKEYAKFEDLGEVNPEPEEEEEEEPSGDDDESGNLEIAEIKNKLSEMNKEQLIEFADKNEYKVTKTKKAENILLELIAQIDVVE